MSENGGVGSAGGAETTNTCETCVDSNPCTIDECRDGRCVHRPVECTSTDACQIAECVEGVCVETPAGLVFDDFETTFSGDVIHSVVVKSTLDRFFYAVSGEFQGVPDLLLGTFEETGAEVATLSLSSTLAAMDLEVAGRGDLVVEPTAGSSLMAYVAVRDVSEAASSMSGQVVRLAFDPDLNLTAEPVLLGSAESYDFVFARLGPVAMWPEGGEPFVVWPARDVGPNVETGLLFQVGEEPASISDPGGNFIAVVDELSGLAPFHVAMAPAAAWMTTDDSNGSVRVFLGGHNGTEPSEIRRCDSDGWIAHGFDVWPAPDRSDTWLVAWSTADPEPYLNLTTVECSSTACSAQRACSETGNGGGIGHIILQTAEDANDPDSYNQVQLLTKWTGSTCELRLSDDGVLVVAQGDDDLAPARPGLAVTPSRRTVAWIQSRNDTEEAHIARYRRCDSD